MHGLIHLAPLHAVGTFGWFQFYLIVHILGVVIAFGPTFAFPIVGAMLEAHPQHAVFAIEFIDKVEHRLTIPLAVVVPLAGTGLIYTAHVDLWKSTWLLVAIPIYIEAFFFAVLIQVPTSGKLLKILQSMPPGPPPEGGPPPEIASLSNKLKYGGMYLTFSVVVILVLMIWRPGNTII